MPRNNRICIFASDLAAIAGLSKFKTLQNIAQKMARREFAYLNCQKLAAEKEIATDDALQHASSETKKQAEQIERCAQKALQGVRDRRTASACMGMFRDAITPKPVLRRSARIAAMRVLAEQNNAAEFKSVSDEEMDIGSDWSGLDCDSEGEQPTEGCYDFEAQTQYESLQGISIECASTRERLVAELDSGISRQLGIVGEPGVCERIRQKETNPLPQPTEAFYKLVKVPNNDVEFLLYGKIDYRLEDGRVCEIKVRRNKLYHYVFPDNRAQCHAYMILTETKSALLRESFCGNDIDHEINFDQKFWDKIVKCVPDYIVCFEKELLKLHEAQKRKYLC